MPGSLAVVSIEGDETPAGPPGFRSAVTIGAFDGVHLGHRRLISELCRVAEADSLRSVVVTFDRHPAAVVRPQSAPRLLTDVGQKLELLVAAGADEVEVVHFDASRAGESAEDFVREVLVDHLGARIVIVGSDFHFGNGRRGNVALLREMGEALDFSVIGYELVADPGDHAVVSSTRIRSLLADCDVEGAAVLLGRVHEVRGEVTEPQGGPREQGPGRLATVGVPAGIALPGPGRYVVLAMRGGAGGPLPAVATVRPPDVDGPAGIALVDIDLPHGSGAGAPGAKAQREWVGGTAVRIRFASHLGPGAPVPSGDELSREVERALSAPGAPARS